MQGVRNTMQQQQQQPRQLQQQQQQPHPQNPSMMQQPHTQNAAASILQPQPARPITIWQGVMEFTEMVRSLHYTYILIVLFHHLIVLL